MLMNMKPYLSHYLLGFSFSPLRILEVPSSTFTIMDDHDLFFTFWGMYSMLYRRSKTVHFVNRVFKELRIYLSGSTFEISLCGEVGDSSKFLYCEY